VIPESRIEELLADAGEFFQACLWDSGAGESARAALAEHGLKQKVLRDFGVGYAPIGPYELMNHLDGLGYSSEELVEAGLANLSVRGRPHAHFRSRVMFPVRDRKGSILGFAGLGTHLGPSWSLWVTSPDIGLYRRSEAVFGLDRAAARIKSSKTAVVLPDCIEVLKAHQEGKKNAVTVHTGGFTPAQKRAVASGVPGGARGLKLKLPPGMGIESPPDEKAPPQSATEPAKPAIEAPPAPPHLNLKRLAIVAATAVAALNVWTGAPLLAVWVGSQVQAGRLLSMWAVATVVAVLIAVEFVLGLILTWLSAKYDNLTGRPAVAGQTSPWRRAMRGDRVEDIRSRYGTSAPERVVAVSVALAVLAFEIWFFFFAGSPLGDV
jgi:hypothetical protein